MFWKKLLIILIVSYQSYSSFVLHLRNNLTDIQSWNRLYRALLHDSQHHTLTDTVSSPIVLTKIRSKQFDEEYLGNTCFETGADLLRAHGHNLRNFSLTNRDVENLLPALLLSIVNSGCEPEGHGLSYQPKLKIWLQGLFLLVLIKAFHSITFCLSYSCVCVQQQTRSNDNRKSSSRTRYHLWTKLGLDAFTCGLMLGTITYHLIPQIDQVTNEGFDYEYLYRGTAFLGGIVLFLMVEKILRLRLNIHKIRSVDSHIPLKDIVNREHDGNVTDGPRPLLSTRTDAQQQQQLNDVKKEKYWIRSYLTYDLSYDFIYGCGLSTAFAYDQFTGFVLSLMIFSEGFRRYLPRLSNLGRVFGFYSLFFSVTFFIFGYLIGGIIVDLDEQFNIRIEYLRKEYLYSVLYGAIFYTTLVTLITELNDLGNHLVSTATGVNRFYIKTRIFFFQHFCLLLGVLITLILAVLWRYYHRLMIFTHVCRRDPSRSFCSQSL